MQNDMRDRLENLILDFVGCCESGWEKSFTDHLIANGVVVLDMKVLSPKNIPLVTHFANMPLDEVFELVKAKQQGMVLKLPCKVGDTIYIVGGKRRCGKMETWINTGKFKLSDIHKVGVTIFTTPEAAKEALKKWSDNNA